MKTPRLIVITGMDGAGKSTLTDKLAAALPGAFVSHIWQLLENPVTTIPFRSKKEIDAFLCALTPDARFFFLAHALKYATDTAMASGVEMVLANSYYYKYFATEIALGAQPGLVESVMPFFPKPDLVIELTLPPAVAVTRKKQLSRYECGCVDVPNAADFLAFQAKAADHWLHFDHANWHTLDAQSSPESLAQAALDLILPA